MHDRTSPNLVSPIQSGESKSECQNRYRPITGFRAFDRLAHRFFVQVKVLFSLVGLSLKGAVWRDESRQDKI